MSEIKSDPEQSYRPRGILIQADSISGNGESQGYHEVVVTLEVSGSDSKPNLDIRLGDKKDTIIMVDLEQVEGALKLLKGRRS